MAVMHHIFECVRSVCLYDVDDVDDVDEKVYIRTG